MREDERTDGRKGHRVAQGRDGCVILFTLIRPRYVLLMCRIPIAVHLCKFVRVE